MGHQPFRDVGDAPLRCQPFRQGRQTTLFALAVDSEMQAEPLCMSTWRRVL